MSNRKFIKQCIKCGKNFRDTNGKSSLCKKCTPPAICKDCGISIKKGKTRCNHCARIFSHKNGIYKGKGWKKFEYNGQKYRSSWEVDFAKIITDGNINFEYERYDKTTKTWPDFYFPWIDRYVEIHPVKPELKVIPKNCVMVITKKQSDTIAKCIVFKKNKPAFEKTMSDMKSREIKKEYDNALDLCMYLKQALLEQEEK